MSTPLYQEFNPNNIPWQKIANDEFVKFDYHGGILEQFFSGSIGSAKTIEHIHQIARHCLENKGARFLMVRRALKDLKRTSWNVLLKHMADIPHAIKSYNKTEMTIRFKNGSEIIGDSYDDMNLEKFRSLELSGVDIEEANEMDFEVYEALKLRVGRLTSVKKNIIQSRSNPDEPSHWLYKYFIESDHSNRKVHYSLTEQNPFLPKWYLENLKKDLSPKMAQRMLMGKWISIESDGIYYNYLKERNFINIKYQINPSYPIDLMHDFNIGQDKPMSAGLGQVINGIFHVFAVFHVNGFRTADIMDEINSQGFIDKKYRYRVFGDSSGYNNDTRSKVTDYDIIEKFLASNGCRYEMCVPKSNPPIRRRHNIVNAKFLNDNKQVGFFQYQGTEWLSEGWTLTSFKKGGHLVENDLLPNQHITTAVGYWIDYCNYRENTGSGFIQL